MRMGQGRTSNTTAGYCNMGPKQSEADRSPPAYRRQLLPRSPNLQGPHDGANVQTMQRRRRRSFCYPPPATRQTKSELHITLLCASRLIPNAIQSNPESEYEDYESNTSNKLAFGCNVNRISIAYVD